MSNVLDKEVHLTLPNVKSSGARPDTWRNFSPVFNKTNFNIAGLVTDGGPRWTTDHVAVKLRKVVQMHAVR